MFKLLIVEDEKWEREGLVDFLDWSGLGIQIVGTAANGVQGLKLAREFLPEIILTDIRMPLMDGLEFAGKVKQFLPDSRTIILTGYDDFEYAREAIQLGVFEYLLKPVQKEPLLDVLKKTVNVLSEELDRLKYVRFLRESVSESRWEVRERFLRNLLEGNPDEQTVLETEREWNLESCEKGIVAVVNQFRIPAGKEILAGELALRIRNTVGEEGIVAWNGPGSRDTVLCLPVGKEGGSRIRDLIQRIRREFQDAGILEVSTGVGTVVKSFRSFPESCLQAKKALECLFFQKDEEVLFYGDIPGREETEVFSFYASAAAYSRKLLNGIASLDPREVTALSEELFGFLGGCALDKVAIIDFFTDLIGEISTLLASVEGPSAPAVTDGDLPGTLQDFLKLEQMEKWVLELFLRANSRFLEKRSRKEEHIVERMMDIIRKEYTESIGIETIAERLELSPNHLGGLFRKHMGKRFTEVLTDYRMKKAEELLDSGTGNVNETAKAVGFVNAAHFCTVFKKTHGISPAEYRKITLPGNARNG